MKTKINPFLLLIPACFDICGSTLMFVALTQCAASVYQMMRGIIVVITAAMSILFLGAKQYTHHWVSLFMIVAGVAIVGIVSVALAKTDAADSSEPATTLTGVLLLLGAQCFTGGQFIVEEKLLSGYYLDPFLVVGLEGFWGVCIWSILLPIFQTVHDCTLPLCDPKTGKLEDTS
jgi:drug/metabolite transporter (DMT)-like permease